MAERFAKLDVVGLARGSTFWPAFLLLSKDKRADLALLYGALSYADDLVDDLPCEEAVPALEAFRKALASGYEHPTAPQGLEALVELCRRRSIPWELWEEFFEGLFQDTHTTRYETYEELEVYCWRVASVVGLMSLKIFEADSPEARQYAVALGRALQLTNILRDIPRDASRGRLYLPLEDLRSFGVTEEELLQGRLSGAVGELLAFEGRRARSYFEEAARLKPPALGRALLPAAVMGSLYEAILRKMERAGFDVWSQRARVSLPEKLWGVARAWLAAR